MIDYKRDWTPLSGADLSTTTQRERKNEFLKDVSSFANTAGGVIVYGVNTRRAPNNDTGIPIDACGVSVHDNWAALLAQLTEIVRDNLRPQFVSINLQPVDMADGKTVLVLGIAYSLAMPHMVWLDKDGRVWRRTESGRYQADIEEIGRMIEERWSSRSEVEAFRDARREWARHLSYPNTNTLLHIVPAGRLDRIMDLRPHVLGMKKLTPFPASDDARFNHDGVIIDGYRMSGGNARAGHLQWFRHGGIELLTTQYHGVEQPNATLSAYALSSLVQERVPPILQYMVEKLDRDPPFALMITLNGIKGRTIGDAPGASWHRANVPHAFEVEVLGLPTLRIDAVTDDFSQLVQPVLDVLWQSAGYWAAPPPRLMA